MKIEEFRTAQEDLYKELREKAVAYLLRKELEHLRYLLVVPTDICKGNSKKWSSLSHRFSENDKLYEVSFSDGFMEGISFLVDDTDGDIIGYR